MSEIKFGEGGPADVSVVSGEVHEGVTASLPSPSSQPPLCQFVDEWGQNCGWHAYSDIYGLCWIHKTWWIMGRIKAPKRPPVRYPAAKARERLTVLVRSGYSDADIAKHTGLTRRYVQNILSGQLTLLTEKIADRIATATGTHVDELFAGVR